MIKGHIYKILWDKVNETNCDFLEVGFVIKDLDEDKETYKIKGKIRSVPYPAINDYIEARKTDKMYNDTIYICSLISVELPVKKDFIFKKIVRLSDKLLTKKEATFLIENNKDIWKSIHNKKLEIGKIKQHKINEIYNNFNNMIGTTDDKEKLKNFLFDSGIILKTNQIDNLIKQYKTSYEIIKIIHTDLIKLLSVNNISITILINIADKLNYTVDEKLKLFIMYNLINSPNGDTCVDYNILIANILKEKGVKFSESLNIKNIDSIITELKIKKYIINYNNYLYESYIFTYENNIGNFLKNKNNKNPYLENFLEQAENFLDSKRNKLNSEQKESFLSIFKSNVNITIGAAGTGKSEILTCLCEFIEELSEISILFLTPTGKACDRLTKGFKKRDLKKISYTIHKFIYHNYEKYENDEDYDEIISEFRTIKNNNYKIIVIDETSMVSLQLFNSFIKQIEEFSNCVLLLLGDTNQLPSIECGDILNNLVLSNKFNLVKLKEIFRSESKDLLSAQNNILNFKPLLENMSYNDNSFKWIKDDPKNTNNFLKVLDDFKELPLIITSTNKVVNEYQSIIKNKYNIDYLNKKSTVINNIEFHEDDYIMIKKNNYDLELTNGMIGRLIKIIKKNEIIVLEIMELFKKNNDEITVLEIMDILEKNKSNNDNIIALEILKKNKDSNDEVIKLEILKIITENKNDKLEILFDGEKDNRLINSHLLDGLSLGYIMTIHKSQGSESENVIILLDQGSMLNTMNLLYTAITRSKKKCILISEEKTIQKIITERKQTKRICNLKDFC